MTGKEKKRGGRAGLTFLRKILYFSMIAGRLFVVITAFRNSFGLVDDDDSKKGVARENTVWHITLRSSCHSDSQAQAQVFLDTDSALSFQYTEPSCPPKNRLTVFGLAPNL